MTEEVNAMEPASVPVEAEAPTDPAPVATDAAAPEADAAEAAAPKKGRKKGGGTKKPKKPKKTKAASADPADPAVPKKEPTSGQSGPPITLAPDRMNEKEKKVLDTFQTNWNADPVKIEPLAVAAFPGA